VKLLWLLATLIAGLVFVEPLSLVVVLASIAAVAGVGGVLGATLQRLRALGMVIVIIGLILGLTVPGEPLLSLGPLAVSREGLAIGVVSILRMFVFAAPLLVIVMTTNNSDLIQGLMAFRLPLDYALMIVLALNFVPLYLEEFGRIADAQKARPEALGRPARMTSLRSDVSGAGGCTVAIGITSAETRGWACSVSSRRLSTRPGGRGRRPRSGRGCAGPGRASDFRGTSGRRRV